MREKATDRPQAWMPRVSFAEPPSRPDDERTPLLAEHDARKEHGSDSEDSNDSTDSYLERSQLHRKSKTILLGGTVGRTSQRLELPNYGNLDELRQRSALLRRICEIIVIGSLFVFIIAASAYVAPPRHHTGPSPRPPNAPTPNSRNPAYLIEATYGAVASENGDCSVVGVQALKDGGNAVDAAIATTFCIGVVNMFSSGIGGGGFMTVRIPPSFANSTSSVYTINFREMAPALSNATMYQDDPDLSLFGGLAVGVPGELRGLEEAHRRWGSLKWEQLVRPSVDLAMGWSISNELAARMRLSLIMPVMLHNPDWSAIFAPEGRLLEEGETIRRINLSRTLETIATEGAGAFYKGPIADSIVKKVRAEGGILSHEDLISYNVTVQRALEGTYRGRKIYTPHAPGSGPVLIHMMNLLERFDFVEDGKTDVNTHRSVEAMKFGFAARTRLTDPAFNDNPERIEEIPTKEFGDLVSANITDDHTHTFEYYHPHFLLQEDHGTSHTSVVDKNGMAVAITSTINLIFGSQVMDPDTGVILNDEMDDFSAPNRPNMDGLWPSPYNFPAPSKRPVSSTTPIIMEYPDGSFYLAIGGSGGTRIFGSVFQTILNLDWGLDISAAIEEGRLHDQLFPSYVDADSIIPHERLEALRQRGHNITVSDINRIAAVVNGVMRRPDGKIYAASDSRKAGIAAGY